jgi:AdoMet-dependent rRNA methyltransferase SPB1
MTEYTVDPRSVLSTAEAVTLAMRMVQDGRRNSHNIVDMYGYNRYAYNDEAGALPKWFVDDEGKHNKPQLPISKEAVEKMRQNQRELDARPIKKVMEAKARKKYKATRKLEKLRKKMNTLIEDGADGEDDPEMGAKLGQINKIMKNAMNKAKSTMGSKVTVVAAKGSNRGNAGRPSGVSGRYKMVDRRMKKEVRAEKRSDKKKGKGKKKHSSNKK